MEALVALHAFGSPEMRDLANQWRTAAEAGDLDHLVDLADRFRSRIRTDLRAE